MSLADPEAGKPCPGCGVLHTRRGRYHSDACAHAARERRYNQRLREKRASAPEVSVTVADDAVTVTVATAFGEPCDADVAFIFREASKLGSGGLRARV